MKTGKKYRGMGQAGGWEKRREQIRGEREVALVKRGNVVGCFDHWKVST